MEVLPRLRLKRTCCRGGSWLTASSCCSIYAPTPCSPWPVSSQWSGTAGIAAQHRTHCAGELCLQLSCRMKFLPLASSSHSSLTHQTCTSCPHLLLLLITYPSLESPPNGSLITSWCLLLRETKMTVNKLPMVTQIADGKAKTLCPYY